MAWAVFGSSMFAYCARTSVGFFAQRSSRAFTPNLHFRKLVLPPVARCQQFVAEHRRHPRVFPGGELAPKDFCAGGSFTQRKPT
jgi:hypothetical protein